MVWLLADVPSVASVRNSKARYRTLGVPPTRDGRPARVMRSIEKSTVDARQDDTVAVGQSTSSARLGESENRRDTQES